MPNPRQSTCLLLSLAIAAGAAAQPQDADRDPRTNPALNNTSADAAERRLQQPSAPRLTVYSREAAAAGYDTQDIAAVSQADVPPQRAGLIREGAFLVERQGILRPLKNGLWAFVLDQPIADAAPRVLVMQPGITLTEMTRLAALSEDTVTYRVSGEIFAYRGRNYILPTFFAIVGAEAATPTDNTPDPAEDEGNNAPETDDPTTADNQASSSEAEEIWRRLLGGDNPDGPQPDARRNPDADRDGADRLLDQLERQTDAREPSARPTRGGARDTDAPITGLIREGTLLSGVSGRIRRLGEGFVFVADNDTDLINNDARPIQMMPGLVLAGMERAVERYGEATRFSVSGRVFVWEGNNHLLPSMYTVEVDRTGNLVSGQ